MVWRHLSTAVTVAGFGLLLVGGFLIALKLFCAQVVMVKECSLVGSKYLLVFPGIILAVAGAFLSAHKETTLADAGSMLRFGEINAHCPNCYAQGIVKSSGLFTHTMECPACRKHWRILDL